jgi:hypothetical protein
MVCMSVSWMALSGAAAGAEPASPSDVVVAFFNAARAKEYGKAEGYWLNDTLGTLKARYGGIQGYCRKWKGWDDPQELQGVEVTGQDVNSIQGKALVLFNAVYSAGDAWECRAQLGKSGGEWKIAEMDLVSLDAN